MAATFYVALEGFFVVFFAVVFLLDLRAIVFAPEPPSRLAPLTVRSDTGLLVLFFHMFGEVVQNRLPTLSLLFAGIDRLDLERLAYVYAFITGREINRHATIVHIETYESGSDGGEETLVTTTFQEANGITTVRTLIRYSSKEDHDAALATGMTEGMEMGYKRLDDLLAESH